MLRISTDRMTNAAFTSQLLVASNGTYDCNTNTNTKAQRKNTVLICFSNITEEDGCGARP